MIQKSDVFYGMLVAEDFDIEYGCVGFVKGLSQDNSERLLLSVEWQDGETRLHYPDELIAVTML